MFVILPWVRRKIITCKPLINQSYKPTLRETNPRIDHWAKRTLNAREHCERQGEVLQGWDCGAEISPVARLILQTPALIPPTEQIQVTKKPTFLLLLSFPNPLK